MDCKARGKGNERVEEATRVVWASSNSGSDDDDEDGSPAGRTRRVVSEERNDLSIKNCPSRSRVKGAVPPWWCDVP